MDKSDQETTPLPPNVQTHFAWIRTRLSLMRTLEAWVRTAIALIGFGFTIVQFFERLDDSHLVAPPKIPGIARYMGLALIGIGTVSLAVAIWQYQCLVKYLHRKTFADVAEVREVPKVPALIIVAVILCVIGLVAFLGIIFRLM